MFSFNREFKAVTFVFPKSDFPRINSLSGALKLFPEDSLSDKEIIKTPLQGAGIAHAIFYSSHYYPTTEDEELRTKISVKRNGKLLYKYDIYLMADGPKDAFHCTIAVPFASLGPEVFNTLHKACGASRPHFRKLNLARALGVLRSGVSKQSRVTVRSLEVPLNADENVDRLWLAGKNVVDSVSYDLLPQILNLLQQDIHNNNNYKPERCQFAYEGDLGSVFRFKADKLGNYAFRVGKEHTALDYVFELLRFFHQHKATDDVLAWPWRGGPSSTADQSGGEDE